jgi:type VI secretion system protein ImpA
MSPSIESLSQPVSEQLPSGESLEYDPQYMQMVTLFSGPGESSVEGKQKTKGKEEAKSGPDWKGLEKLAGELLGRTRDLRVQVYATIASLHTGGIPAFRDNLQVLKVFIEDFWDTVHPQLDPADGNDPTVRMNTLQMLNQYSLISVALDRAKLVELKGMGRFGLREVELAQGKDVPEEGEAVPDLNVIRQAFVAADPASLQALHAAVDESLALLAAIKGAWAERSGQGEGVDFENAEKSLEKIAAVLTEFSPSEASGTAAQPANAGTAGNSALQSGVISSRSDVIRALDRVCEYYSVHEPSSPVPLLLRRAQRLVEKSFMEILEDMVPDGVSQARIVSGKTDGQA